MNKRIIEGLLFSNEKIIDSKTNCWLYKKGIHKTGYAYICIDGKKYSIHRLSMYVFNNFDLTSELNILHKLICPNKNCWNPEHLYIGDQSDNMIDTVKKGNHNNSSKTHCINGHEFNEWNTSYYHNKRICKMCKKLWRQNYILNKELSQ
jgi:hypothetical protein